MYHLSKICRAGVLKPALSSAVSAETTVQRFIGLDAARFSNISLLNSIKENTDGVAKHAATVASAYLYLLSHKPTTAVEEIDNVVSKIKDPSVLRCAVGVRLQARNLLLDLKDTSLNVSGGASESEVSSFRTQVLADYQLLKDSSPGCWLVKLACAEFLLYTGKLDDALQEFAQIEAEIASFISASKPVTSEIATGENTNIFSFIGLQLRRLNIVHEHSANFDDPHVSSVLGQLKDTLKVSIGDAEASELGYVMEAVNAGHHFHDFFPREGDYDALNSPGANKVKNLMSDYLLFSEPSKVDVNNSIPKPSKPFGGKDKLMKLLNTVPDKNYPVSSIRAALGSDGRVGDSSDCFGSAFRNIENSLATYETSGSTEFVLNRRNFAVTLAQQILYRTKVQQGVALIEKQKYHEAIAVISPVILSNEYVYMWRAFLARSRAHKALGNITASDRDLKKLMELKQSITNRTPYVKC